MTELLTPDFDVYPLEPGVDGVELAPRWVEVGWTDGSSGRFHHVWLRDNCPCPECVHQITKEQIFELVWVPAVNPASAVAVGPDGWPGGRVVGRRPPQHVPPRLAARPLLRRPVAAAAR